MDAHRVESAADRVVPRATRPYERRAPNPTVRGVDRASLLAAIRHERAAEAHARLAPPTSDEDGWPRCRHCGHSCTGSYASRPHCVRCDTSHRLALDEVA